MKSIKIRYYNKKGELTEEVLYKPAFIIGNGINFYSSSEKQKIKGQNNLKKDDEIDISWGNLLFSLIPNDVRNEYKITENQKIEKQLKGLTYPEIAELGELFLKKQSGKKYNNKYKRLISNKIDSIDTIRTNKRLYVKQKNIVDRIKRLNCPILTTNFDHLLLKGLEIRKADVKDKKLKKMENPFIINENGSEITKHRGVLIPVNIYFREKAFIQNDNISEEFAIWPIHGTKRYPGSICINNLDYSKLISKIDESLKFMEKNDKEHEWKGKYTWPNIFMNNDLIILGLGLDFSETDLRSLLVRRQNYIKRNQLNLKTYYIYRKTETLDLGKELFFENLDITLIKMSENEIYELDYIQ